MSVVAAESRPSRGIALFVTGGILLLVGIVGIVMYITAFPDAARAEAETTGVLRGVTVIGAALFTGLGALLIAIGIGKRIALSRRG